MWIPVDIVACIHQDCCFDTLFQVITFLVLSILSAVLVWFLIGIAATGLTVDHLGYSYYDAWPVSTKEWDGGADNSKLNSNITMEDEN